MVDEAIANARGDGKGGIKNSTKNLRYSENERMMDKWVSYQTNHAQLPVDSVDKAAAKRHYKTDALKKRDVIEWRAAFREGKTRGLDIQCGKHECSPIDFCW